MPFLRPKIYKYTTELRWTERHKGILSFEGKRDIEIGCPPEFGGEYGVWSPEELFVASVNICIMTTFLDLIDKKKGEILSYESRAIGKACLVVEEKRFRFIGVDVYPVIKVKEENRRIAEEAIERAAEECMVSNSLKFKPEVRYKIV